MVVSKYHTTPKPGYNSLLSRVFGVDIDKLYTLKPLIKDNRQKIDPTKVIALRRYDPFATLQQIADTFHITRERVRQILAGAKIATGAERIPRLCEVCGKPLISHQPRHCSRYCLHQASIAEAVCSNCGEVFELPKSQLTARIKRHITNNLFCSRFCFGQFAGKNYGFFAHPENSGGRKQRSGS